MREDGSNPGILWSWLETERDSRIRPGVLTRDDPEHKLEVGDIGTVLHVYSDDSTYEVEFVTAAGETVAVLTLTDADVRPMKAREILHTRLLPAV